jgi:hypothetical protein
MQGRLTAGRKTMNSHQESAFWSGRDTYVIRESQHGLSELFGVYSNASARPSVSQLTIPFSARAARRQGDD